MAQAQLSGRGRTRYGWKPSKRDPEDRQRASTARRRRPAKAALVAAMRKLLTILNAIPRDR